MVATLIVAIVQLGTFFQIKKDIKRITSYYKTTQKRLDEICSLLAVMKQEKPKPKEQEEPTGDQY